MTEILLLPADAGSLSTKDAVDGSRRERKKLATRHALRVAALRLVAERGYAHVTVEDIAEAADVSTRTFFNYFDSKESAVVGWEPRRVEEVRRAVLDRPASESALEALKAALVAQADAISAEFDELGDEGHAWLQRLCVVGSDPGLVGAYAAHVTAVERALTEAVAERLAIDAETELYPALVSAAALAAARVAAQQWSSQGGIPSLRTLTAAAIDVLAAGFSCDAPPSSGPTGSRRARRPAERPRNSKTTLNEDQ